MPAPAPLPRTRQCPRWVRTKLGATADHDAGVLRVDAIHQDVAFDKTMTAAVDGEIKDLAH